jgi:hypothetical protein
VARRGNHSSPGPEPLGANTPMGPPENHTHQPPESGGPKRPARRPRTRICLLKGCEQRFRPQRPRERYCSEECRQAAREWSRWKAQQCYRATAAGRERRNGQSRRYRERVRLRQQPAREEAVAEAARVIIPEFFRARLSPARLLPGIPSLSAIAGAALLFPGMPAGHGTGLAARTALAASGASEASQPLSEISLKY